MVRCSNCGAFKDAGARCRSCGHVPTVGEAPARACKRCGVAYSTRMYREPYCTDCTKKIDRHRDRVEHVAATVMSEIVAQQLGAWARAARNGSDHSHPLDTLNRWASGDGEGRIRNQTFNISIKIAEKFINYYDGIELEVGSIKPKTRLCERCQSEDPVLWDRRQGRYVCRKCHSEPDDPFFKENA